MENENTNTNACRGSEKKTNEKKTLWSLYKLNLDESNPPRLLPEGKISKLGRREGAAPDASSATTAKRKPTSISRRKSNQKKGYSFDPLSFEISATHARRKSGEGGGRAAFASTEASSFPSTTKKGRKVPRMTAGSEDEECNKGGKDRNATSSC